LWEKREGNVILVLRLEEKKLKLGRSKRKEEE